MTEPVSSLKAVQYLAKPETLWTREDLSKHPPPEQPGLYGWYFIEIPGPLGKRKFRCRGKGRVRVGRWLFRKWTLLYIGRAETSLRERIVDEHFDGVPVRGQAMSTLRLSLGCLLARTDPRLGLVRYGSDPYSWGRDGEQVLSDWMAKNCRVAWYKASAYDPAECQAIVEAERQAIEEYDVALNITYNQEHPFCETLKGLRETHKNLASLQAEAVLAQARWQQCVNDMAATELRIEELWQSIR